MPFFEYMLLAILGSAPAAIPGATPERTITADAVTQPTGGTPVDVNAGIGLLGQDTGGSTDAGTGKKPTTGKKPIEHTRSARHHRSPHKGKEVRGTGKTRNSPKS
jgi:hypothetical protein